MIDQELTNILPKRIVASLIDLGVVGLLSALVARSQVKIFSFTSKLPNGNPDWGPEELAELRVIDEQINRQITFSSSMWVWHGRGLALSVLSVVIFSLVAWVLIPANTGWSAGHRIMGLRVTDKKGEKPLLDSYLRRYLVGILDLAPFVVPGLLGWFVASRNEYHQRIGDLSADTVVIDASKPLKFVDPDLYHAPQTGQPEVATSESTVNVDEAIGQPMPDLTAIVPPGLGTSVPAVPVGAAQPGGGSEQQDPPILDLEQPAAEPAVAFDAAAEDREILEIRDIPQEPDQPSHFISALEQVDAEALAEPEVEPAVPEGPKPTWHMPEAEPAPVWDPSKAGAGTGATPTAPANVSGAATATAAKPQSAPPAQSPASGAALAPTWNEEWQAWLFWDPKHNQWLRHDPDSNVWVPIQA